MIWFKIIATSILGIFCIRILGNIFWPGVSTQDMPKPAVVVLGAILAVCLLAIPVSIFGFIWS